MTHPDRPNQISTILKTIGSGKDTEISAELETYITDLEAKQPDRPARIAAILRSLGAQYPADIEGSLETYIASLEAGQQPSQPDHNHSQSRDPDNAPIWSHQRAMQRELRRRDRALKKQNDYHKGKTE